MNNNINSNSSSLSQSNFNPQNANKKLGGEIKQPERKAAPKPRQRSLSSSNNESFESASKKLRLIGPDQKIQGKAKDNRSETFVVRPTFSANNPRNIVIKNLNPEEDKIQFNLPPALKTGAKLARLTNSNGEKIAEQDSRGRITNINWERLDQIPNNMPGMTSYAFGTANQAGKYPYVLTVPSSISPQELGEISKFNNFGINQQRSQKPSNPFEGTEGDDFIQGDQFANTILGKGGNDQLFGLGGADTIIGGDGDDQISRGEGIDIIYSGSGNDTIEVENFQDDVIEVQTLPSGETVFEKTGPEIIYTGSGKDKINTKVSVANGFINQPIEIRDFTLGQDKINLQVDLSQLRESDIFKPNLDDIIEKNGQINWEKFPPIQKNSTTGLYEVSVGDTNFSIDFTNKTSLEEIDPRDIFKFDFQEEVEEPSLPENFPTETAEETIQEAISQINGLGGGFTFEKIKSATPETFNSSALGVPGRQGEVFNQVITKGFEVQVETSFFNESTGQREKTTFQVNINEAGTRAAVLGSDVRV